MSSDMLLKALKSEKAQQDLVLVDHIYLYKQGLDFLWSAHE